MEKKILIEYIYDFAWNYGRFFHFGDAEKIKAAINERMQLPEEFLSENPQYTKDQILTMLTSFVQDNRLDYANQIYEILESHFIIKPPTK